MVGGDKANRHFSLFSIWPKILLVIEVTQFFRHIKFIVAGFVLFHDAVHIAVGIIFYSIPGGITLYIPICYAKCAVGVGIKLFFLHYIHLGLHICPLELVDPVLKRI